MKHQHAVLIRDLPGLNPSLIRSMGYLNTTNIRDLVSEQMAAQLETEALGKRK